MVRMNVYFQENIWHSTTTLGTYLGYNGIYQGPGWTFLMALNYAVQQCY